MLSAILQENLKKHLLFCEIYTIILIHAFAKCRRGETGRRNRLKICRGRPRIGSIPIDGTNPKDARPQNGVGRLFVLVFLCSSFCARLFVCIFWYTFFHTAFYRCFVYTSNSLCFFLTRVCLALRGCIPCRSFARGVRESGKSALRRRFRSRR